MTDTLKVRNRRQGLSAARIRVAWKSAAARDLARQAHAARLSLTGPDGLLSHKRAEVRRNSCRQSFGPVCAAQTGRPPYRTFSRRNI
jgi:hypothetical protein